MNFITQGRHGSKIQQDPCRLSGYGYQRGKRDQGQARGSGGINSPKIRERWWVGGDQHSPPCILSIPSWVESAQYSGCDGGCKMSNVQTKMYTRTYLEYPFICIFFTISSHKPRWSDGSGKGGVVLGNGYWARLYFKKIVWFIQKEEDRDIILCKTNSVCRQFRKIAYFRSVPSFAD